MKAVSIHDAKTNLSKYIAAAKKGERIYIGSFGKPEVELTVLKQTDKSGRRNLGIAKGKFRAAPDAFSEGTDQKIADLMYGRGKDKDGSP